MEPNQTENLEKIIKESNVTSLQKNIIFIVFFVLLLCSFSFYVFAQEKDVNSDYSNFEKINSFDIQAQINPDATVSVVETIDYDFGDQEKRGIFRTIPLGFTAKGEPEHTMIDIISVTDEKGNAYKYSITSTDPINVKIGDPFNIITGVHTYKISYTLKNSIGFFSDYDEWYWNLTGNEWLVPIFKVSATVVLPKEINKTDFKFSDYCGYESSIDSCGIFLEKDNKTILYLTNLSKVFGVGEGVTIGVGFPKGLVVAPPKMYVLLSYFYRTWFIPFPFILVFFWFRKRFLYIKKRRKYFKDNTIVVEYDAGDFNPLEVALLVNGKAKNKDISAVIVSLAIRGYVKIEEKNGEFSFKKLKEVPSDITESEKLIFESVCGISESNFSSKQAMNFFDSISTADSRLIARDYFANNNKSKFNKLSSNFPTTIIMPLFLAVNPGAFVWLLVGNWAGFIFSGTCVLIAIFNIFLKKNATYLSEKGLEAERKLLGLKLYIEVAEKDRINFANTPSKTPELFEKLLPHAMVFGLETKWATEFQNIYQVNPIWYSGTTINKFSTIAFVSSMHSIQSSTDNAIASSVKSSPSSSWSSSSGGSSGGGSSGGGGGGGGGGSW